MLLLIALLLVCGATTTFGCTCVPPRIHPQAAFCNQDIVIKGTVRKATPPTSPALDAKFTYEVRVRRVFKGSVSVKSTITVETPRDDGLCGITNLKPGATKRTYLMTARDNGDGTYSIALCSTHIVLWANVVKPPKIYNPNKRKSYPGKNFLNCNKCKIQFCPTGNCGIVAPPPNACTYSEDEDVCVRPVRCEYKGDGKCRWSTNNCFPFGPGDITSG